MSNRLLDIYNLGHDVEDADFEWWEWYGIHPIKRYWRRTMAKHILSFVDNPKTSLVLGCGSSPFTLMLPGKVTGLDISLSKLAFMKLRAENVFINADIRKIPDIGKFDLITASEVLEHIGYVELVFVLYALNDMLNTKGRIVIAAPNYDSKFGAFMEKLFHPYHYKFSFKELDRLLLDIGFKFVGTRSLLWDKVVCYEKY